MDHFRRSLFHLLVVMLVLLFIAWAALKLMQNGGDIDGLLLELRRTVRGWGRDITSTFNKVVGFIRPLFEKVSAWFGDATSKAMSRFS